MNHRPAGRLRTDTESTENNVKDFSLHVYAQGFWHSNATIVGSTEAIKLLHQLCEMALESQTAGGEFMTADGEGYDCRVICIDDKEQWAKLKLPYVHISDNRENIINPND